MPYHPQALKFSAWGFLYSIINLPIRNISIGNNTPISGNPVINDLDKTTIHLYNKN